jgi:dihydrolipoamide dehydrogenase
VTTTVRPVDLAVVGGGPGGYATALRAAGNGLSVALVESELLGGTCLHRGCIPSKALLHVAALADGARQGADVGVRSTYDGVDPVAAGVFRDRIVAQLYDGLRSLIASRGITVIQGTGRVREPGQVEVVGTGGRSQLSAANIVLATGSEPTPLPDLTVDGHVVLTSDQAVRFARVPHRALVVGAGAIGMEFASFWRSVGAEVTLVELADRVLPLENPTSSSAVARAFHRRGISVQTGVAVTGAKVVDGEASVEMSDGTSLEVDTVLVAVGRRPRTAGSGAEHLGLLDSSGYVAVDALGRTALPGVWAVGDVTATLGLAHAAFSEGTTVADAAAGLDVVAVDHRQVPRVTYCRPEVASVGWNEPEARAAGLDITVTTETLAGNARALIEGETGSVTLITHSDTGEVLGAHLVGPAATELVAEAALATGWSATAGELGAVTHAHPSLAESIHETALAAAGRPFHSHSKNDAGGHRRGA